jgi:hypothetical protein
MEWILTQGMIHSLSCHEWIRDGGKIVGAEVDVKSLSGVTSLYLTASIENVDMVG